jgi:hypothetical protein
MHPDCEDCEARLAAMLACIHDHVGEEDDDV